MLPRRRSGPSAWCCTRQRWLLLGSEKPMPNGRRQHPEGEHDETPVRGTETLPACFAVPLFSVAANDCVEILEAFITLPVPRSARVHSKLETSRVAP
jgi:hypothetical protein